MNNQKDTTGAGGPVTSTASQPQAGYRTTLTLLVLAYTLSICDRMILSILFLPLGLESVLAKLKGWFGRKSEPAKSSVADQ